MKDKDLLKIMGLTGFLLFFTAQAFPEGSMYIALGMWPVVLLFDWLDNRGKSPMVVLE